VGLMPASQMGELEVREFLMHLVETKKVGAATRKMHVAGIKFLYEVTLRRPEVVAAIPWPKVTHGVPEILSGSEIGSLLDAVDALKHRAVIMTAYGAGLRVSEVCGAAQRGARSDDAPNALGVSGLVERKEGGEMLAGARVDQPWLFPGKQSGCPLSEAAVRYQLQVAAKKTGLTKRVTPHTLRHSFTRPTFSSSAPTSA
jgi:integrase/recombinase XerD